jgi:hypothetical protein
MCHRVCRCVCCRDQFERCRLFTSLRLRCATFLTEIEGDQGGVGESKVRHISVQIEIYICANSNTLDKYYDQLRGVSRSLGWMAWI